MQVPWLKPAVWGVFIGAVATMIVGFSGAGWTLGSTAEKMARERAESAVITALTPVCVASFERQPDAAAKLAKLQEANPWARGTLIEEGGWATIPGNNAPNSAVARACAAALTKT